MSDDLSLLLPGLWQSIAITGASLSVGFPVGLAFGVLLASRKAGVRWPVLIVVDILRGFPALVTLYIVYFGLPVTADIVLDGFTSIVIAFGLTAGAYMAEIFRAAIEGVPRQHREAAAALGMSRTATFRVVVFPQVWRGALPPLVGVAILVFQGSALAYAIGMRELLGSAYAIGTRTFRMFDALVVAGALYLAITGGIYLVELYLQKRIDRGPSPPEASGRLAAMARRMRFG